MSRGVLLATLQTLLVFAAGVLGNKVADLLNVPPSLVLVFTAIVLVLLSLAAGGQTARTQTVAPARTEPPPDNQRATRRRRRTRSPLPRSIVGMFPIGLAAGMIVTVATSGLLWLRGVGISPFGPTIHGREVAAIVLGMILCLVLAVELDGHLALSFGIGHAVGSATVLVVLLPTENELVTETYLGQAAWFAGYGWLLIFIRDRLVAIWAALTRPRV